MVESLDPSSDRAEKAARAKDRLKKFQAKKRAKESVNPSISSSDPISNHTPIHPSPSTERFDLTDDRFSVGSDPTDGGPIADGNDDKINHTPPDRTRSTVSKLSPSTEIPKSFKDSQIVLSESDGVSKIVDPKDSSQRQTIALLVNEKSVLNDQLESYRKRVEDLNHDIEKHQNALTFQMNFSNEELENSRTSINNLNSQLLDSNNLITALRQELDRKRSELQDLNQSQSNGTEEVIIRDYEAKLRMKQNHSDAVESELSRLKDLIKSQDDQSREQAGALDQLNRVIKGLRNDLDLKDQSSTSLSSQLEDLRILRIDTQNELSSTQSQLQESQSELLKLRSHTDSTRSKLSCLQDSYDSLSSKLPLIEKQLLESNSRRDSLQRDNQSLLANLEELRIKTVELTDIKVESGERLEESKKLAQDRNELLLIKDQELREQRQAQELEKQTFEQHIITLRDQVEDQDRNFLQIRTGLDEEIEKNRQCLNSLASQLQDSQLQLSQSLQKLQDAQKAQEDSEARNDILETEKSKLEAQNFDRDQSLRLSNDEAERLRDQIELLAKDLDLEKGQRLELEKQKLQTRQELESLRSTTVEQSAKLDDYEKTVEGKLNLLEQANDRVSKLESQNRDLSQSLSSSDSRVESLQAEFKDAQKCLREHQVTLQSRIDEIREKSNSLESASKKISELEGALELAKVDSKDLSDKFDKAKLEHKKQFNDYSQRLTETEARAVDELGNSNMRYQELQIFSESLQAQLNQSHADREEMKNRLESLESELLASQRSVSELSNQLESEALTNEQTLERITTDSRKLESELRSEIERLKISETEKDSSNKKLLSSIEELRAKLSSAEVESESIRKDRQRLELELENCRSDLSEQRQSLASALHDLVTEKNNLSDVENQVCEKKIEIESLLKLKDSTEAELKSQKERSTQSMSDLQIELKSVRKKLELQEENFIQSEQRSAEFQDEISRLEQEKNVLIKEMEAGKEGENRILESSRKEILSLKDSLKRIKEVEESMKRDLGQTKLEFEQNDQVKETEIHKLNEELKELKRTRDSLQVAAEKTSEQRLGLTHRVKELEKSLERSSFEKESLEKRVKDLVEDSNLRIEEKVSEIRELLKELDRMKSVEQTIRIEKGRDIETFEQELSRKAIEIEELSLLMRSSGVEHQDQVQGFSQKVQALEKELNETRSERQKLDQSFEELQKEVNAERESINLENQSKLNLKEEQVAKLQAKLDQTVTSESAAKRALDDREVEIADLRTELKDLKAKLEGLCKIDEEKPRVDQDYLDSILQQHTIDLSIARSQIRSLETRVFESESKSHEMLTRVEDLQDQLRGAESILKERTEELNRIASMSKSPAQPHSLNRIPSVLLSPTRVVDEQSSLGSFINVSLDGGDGPFGSKFRVDESSLSPQTRNYRRQSLNLLRTRMQTELGLFSSSSGTGATSSPPPPTFSLTSSSSKPTINSKIFEDSEGTTKLGLVKEEEEAIPRELDDFSKINGDGKVVGRIGTVRVSEDGQQDVGLTDDLKSGRGTDHQKTVKIRRSSNLGDDMVWCGDCVGDLFVV